MSLSDDQKLVLEVASQHLDQLNERQRDVVERINRRLANWGIRGDFVMHREKLVIGGIQIKLSHAIGVAKARKSGEKNTTREMCRKIKELHGLNQVVSK